MEIGAVPLEWDQAGTAAGVGAVAVDDDSGAPDASEGIRDKLLAPLRDDVDDDSASAVRDAANLGLVCLSVNMEVQQSQPPHMEAPDTQTSELLGLQEEQDNMFVLCETEFQTVTDLLSTLSNTPIASDLEKFRNEYEKMHKAVLRSRQHATVVMRQHQELQAEASSNRQALEESERVAVSDAMSIGVLKENIAVADGAVEAAARNEENLREDLRQLKLDIASLTQQLKQGVGLSVAQERTLNELIATKDALTRELEAEFDKIVYLRNSITDITEKIHVTDQLKGDREREIFDLKDRNAEKKAEIDAEMRNKDRLEREIREIRTVVAVKSSEVRAKQDAVNRATDDLAILESQIRSQKQQVEKLLKSREGLVSRTAKLQVDCADQIAQTSTLMQENELLSKELKEREKTLHKNKMEVKRVQKMKQALIAKNQDLESQRSEAEGERKTLRAATDAKAAELARVQRSIEASKKAVEDLTREQGLIHRNSRESDQQARNHEQQYQLLLHTHHNLRIELSREQVNVNHLRSHASAVTLYRDKCAGIAAKITEKCVGLLRIVKQKELDLFEEKKRFIRADTHLKHKVNLYEAVQSDRNLHAKNLIHANAEITEMKRKLKIMNYQINGYKEDINSKYNSLAKEDLEHSKLEKDIMIIGDEVKSLTNQNELAQAYIKSQLAEEMKLNHFVHEADLERSRQENALQVLISERDQLSSQLIRQNEELSKAYNEIKTKQSSLIRSENNYKEKLQTINALLQEITELRVEDTRLSKSISDLPTCKQQIRRLTIDINKEKARIKALEEELKNPINVHRWRKLEGSNPKAYDMVQMLQSLQKTVIAKTKELQDKEELIQNKEELYLHLKGVLSKQVGPEAVEQVEEFHKILKDKQLQLKHMDVELNMYRTQVKEYKHSLNTLNEELERIKEEYVCKRKAGKMLPRLPDKARTVQSSTAAFAPLPPISSTASVVAPPADVGDEDAISAHGFNPQVDDGSSEHDAEFHDDDGPEPLNDTHEEATIFLGAKGSAEVSYKRSESDLDYHESAPEMETAEDALPDNVIASDSQMLNDAMDPNTTGDSQTDIIDKSSKSNLLEPDSENLELTALANEPENEKSELEASAVEQGNDLELQELQFNQQCDADRESGPTEAVIVENTAANQNTSQETLGTEFLTPSLETEQIEQQPIGIQEMSLAENQTLQSNSDEMLEGRSTEPPTNEDNSEDTGGLKPNTVDDVMEQSNAGTTAPPLEPLDASTLIDPLQREAIDIQEDQDQSKNDGNHQSQ